jgi:hypothetical protein
MSKELVKALNRVARAMERRSYPVKTLAILFARKRRNENSSNKQ